MGGKVGPNAVIQLADVLRDELGEAPARAVFARAGLAAALDAPPAGMLPVAAVRGLYAALAETLGAAAPDMARKAGERTGAYILRRRIPGPVHWLLPRLPRQLAARLLLGAIGRNAWTFGARPLGGSVRGDRAALALDGDAIGLDGAPWHRAVIETLFRRLVAPGCTVRHRAGADGRQDFEIALA